MKSRALAALAVLFWVLVFAGLLTVRALNVTPCGRGDLICQEDQ
jgi:hypothetical protein